MKNLLVLLFFFSISFHLSGQDTKEIYCQIVGTSKFMSTKMNIAVDYGEERKFFQGANFIKNEETGKIQSFNSMVDALNYMGDQGWIFVTAYVLSVSNQNVYHYLLKKEVPIE